MHRPILPAILLLTSLQAGCSILFDRADEPRQVDDAGINDAATDDLDADTRLVLGPVETLSGGTAHASYSNVVFDGSDYRVIWEDGKDGSGGEVYARTIGSAQTVRITTTGGTKPSSVWNGNSLAIA